MSKRPNKQEPLIFTLELLQRIPRGRKITAPELQQQLEAAGLVRSLRTVQRQLDTLCEHFDIERDDREKPYGYSWKKHAKGMSLPTLSQQESLLLTLAEEYLRNLLPANLMKSMQGFFTQAKCKLDPLTNQQLEREWLSKVKIVSVAQPLLAPKISSGVFEKVSNALYENKWLNIDYKNSSGKRSKIEVMPLGLAQQGPRLYLVCRFKGYDNERSLALHRMISAKASTIGFERPQSFNLQAYDDDGRFGFGDGKEIQLNFKISKNAGAHLLETPLSLDQTVRELKDDYEITATVVDAERLDWWLKGFGEAVKKVKKKPLKKIV